MRLCSLKNSKKAATREAPKILVLWKPEFAPTLNPLLELSPLPLSVAVEFSPPLQKSGFYFFLFFRTFLNQLNWIFCNEISEFFLGRSIKYFSVFFLVKFLLRSRISGLIFLGRISGFFHFLGLNQLNGVFLVMKFLGFVFEVYQSRISELFFCGRISGFFLLFFFFVKNCSHASILLLSFCVSILLLSISEFLFCEELLPSGY